MFQKVLSFFNRPSLPIQVLSDLHLEINQQYLSYEIPVCAQHLILAGDIGRLTDSDNYREFLRRQTDRFKVVLLVLGNHEFYNETFAAGLEKARQLEQEPSLNGKLVVLHQKRYDVPGSCVSVLGCTLWSKVPSESREIVRAKIKDFQKITDWTVDDHNAAHDSDLAWLRREIQSIRRENERTEKWNPKRSILVVTHHAPLLQRTSAPKNALNPWRFAFGTDFLSQVPDGVKVWVFGHTHHTTEFKEGRVKVVSRLHAPQD
ncbi:calcineurin-like phosphoesterase [Aspergillus steynii IBT 23096]|uniref:Calcineurin-like phosphoesterase n=1 Tax=Aspergillus steynii IBT 23096 TaxID=1392250 RepID=A0A2I2G8T0_9EURO|nr:calcineurin-like phosphoesterase [Aspergillus steynii IBT 23096]PLB49253.1 calcineurin-like phosphoesterase [Aspergillus steynii IBT 23096]